MWKVSEVGNDWGAEGTLISKHKTRELAEKRVNKEAKKRVKTLYYTRWIEMKKDKCYIIDYGLWSRFLKMEEIEDDTEI